MSASLIHARGSSPGEILARNIGRLQQKNPKASLRSFATKLGVSAPFLSRVLSGQQVFPVRRFSEVCASLKLDAVAQDDLLQAIARDLVRRAFSDADPTLQSRLTKAMQAARAAHRSDYALVPDSDFALLSKWYILPILDLVTCENFRENPTWIASRLGITSEVASHTLGLLKRFGYLKEQGGRLQKRSQRVRFPTRTAQAQVTEFHLQMLRQVEKALRKPRAEFDRRLVNGVVFAADPSRLEEAKAILNRAVYEIAELMADGPCTEVYYVAGHLVPLTSESRD